MLRAENQKPENLNAEQMRSKVTRLKKPEKSTCYISMTLPDSSISVSVFVGLLIFRLMNFWPYEFRPYSMLPNYVLRYLASGSYTLYL